MARWTINCDFNTSKYLELFIMNVDPKYCLVKTALYVQWIKTDGMEKRIPFIENNLKRKSTLFQICIRCPVEFFLRTKSFSTQNDVLVNDVNAFLLHLNLILNLHLFHPCLTKCSSQHPGSWHFTTTRIGVIMWNHWQKWALCSLHENLLTSGLKHKQTRDVCTIWWHYPYQVFPRSCLYKYQI